MSVVRRVNLIAALAGLVAAHIVVMPALAADPSTDQPPRKDGAQQKQPQKQPQGQPPPVRNSVPPNAGRPSQPAPPPVARAPQPQPPQQQQQQRQQQPQQRGGEPPRQQRYEADRRPQFDRGGERGERGREQRSGGNDRYRRDDREGRDDRARRIERGIAAGAIIIGGTLGYRYYTRPDRDDVFDRCDRNYPDFDYDSGTFRNEDGDRELCPYLD